MISRLQVQAVIGNSVLVGRQATAVFPSHDPCYAFPFATGSPSLLLDVFGTVFAKSFTSQPAHGNRQSIHVQLSVVIVES